MDAKEFITERQRMCNHFKATRCFGCPVETSICSFEAKGEELDKLIGEVEKWSKKHPRKTNFNKLSDVVQGLFKGVKMTVTNDWDGNVGTVYIEAGAGYWDMVFKEEEEDG